MTLQWGIVGAGKISHDFVTAVHILPKEEHEVIAVAAQQLARSEEFAKLHKIKRAYDQYTKLAKDKDIEIVYIGNLNPQHFEVVKMMLNSGKHVLCEKPMTMNYKQTSELIKIAKEKKLFLMEAIWSRCFPTYDIIKREIESGNIGDVHQVIASFGFAMTEVQRLNQKKLGGGTILDLGVYCLQFLLLVFGNEEPEKIKATGFVNNDGVDVSTSATLLFKGNRTATVLTHSLVNLPNEAIVIGTKGIIKVPLFWCPPKVELPSGTINKPLPKPGLSMNFVNSAGLCYEASEVRACIRKGLLESPKVSHETSLLIAKLEDELRKQLGVEYPEDKY
ncbi:trans-1,2-dihydrobenzene-1,2-diol dehydrogenase-like [Prorops nasuta]|uniref:trans-1,2-dihydrobenzene-1,2-diol dehydrogenase-like n=1 Tax=Prorops nasuta TaxID=863751 RepID=UPI0034CEB3A5